MAVTARSVVYTMVTSVACTEVRDFRCLAIKYKKHLLGGLENGLGDPKIALGGGFGRGYPSRSILDQFWTPFWDGFWGLIEFRWEQKSS